MKLTATQLSATKAFIQSRGIKYIDVQTEVLDHVACMIEEKMEANQELSFESALTQTHASFGIFGFSVMEDAIKEGMNKRFSKVFWKNFGRLFGLRYLPLMLFGGFLTYQFQGLVNDQDQLASIFLIALLGLFGLLLLFALKNKAYHDFLTYKTSMSYLMLMGSMFGVLNYATRGTKAIVFQGLAIQHLLSTIVLLLLVNYVIAAFQTAVKGIKESKLLMEKYQLLVG